MKEVKLIVFFIFVFCFVNNITAQLFVEIGTAYSKPLYYKNNNNSGFMDIYSYVNNVDGVDTSYIVINKYNMGNGINFNGEIGYELDKLFVFSINTLFLNNLNNNFLYNPFVETHNGEQDIVNEITNHHSYSEYTHTSTYYGQRFSLTPKISCFLKNNRFKYEVSFGATLSYLKVYSNVESISMSMFTSYDDSEITRTSGEFFKYEFSKNNHLSGYFAFATYFSVSPNLDVKISAELNGFLGFYATEGTQYYFSQTSTENNIVTGFSEDKNYYDVSSSYDLDIEHYNFNTLNFSFGIRYSFNQRTRQ